MYSNRPLYPMVGTGAFIAMFLAGLSAGHQLGLHILTTLLLGYLAGCAGVSLIARLERSDKGG